MIAAVMAVTTRLAMVYPWALIQLSCGSASNKFLATLVDPGFCSQSTHRALPGDTGNPHAAQVPTSGDCRVVAGEGCSAFASKLRPCTAGDWFLFSGMCHKEGSSSSFSRNSSFSARSAACRCSRVTLTSCAVREAASACSSLNSLSEINSRKPIAASPWRTGTAKLNICGSPAEACRTVQCSVRQVRSGSLSTCGVVPGTCWVGPDTAQYWRVPCSSTATAQLVAPDTQQARSASNCKAA